MRRVRIRNQFSDGYVCVLPPDALFGGNSNKFEVGDKMQEWFEAKVLQKRHVSQAFAEPFVQGSVLSLY